MTDKIKEFREKFVTTATRYDTNGEHKEDILHGDIKEAEAWLQKALKEEYDRGKLDMFKETFGSRKHFIKSNNLKSHQEQVILLDIYDKGLATLSKERRNK